MMFRFLYAKNQTTLAGAITSTVQATITVASNAGIPGLALPAGLVQGRLPVGLELDGPAGGDRRLLAIGLAFEAILGTLPAPEI